MGPPPPPNPTEDDASLWKVIFDRSWDGVVLLDAEGKTKFANQRFADMLGCSLDEVRQMSVWDWDAQWSAAEIKPMIKGDPEITFETLHRRKDGTIFAVEITSNPLEWKGTFYRYCICRDITERRRSEQALRDSEERYRCLFEAESDALFILDRASEQIQEANAAFCRLYGYSLDEARRLNFRELAPGNSGLPPPLPAEAAASGSLHWHRRKDQTVFPVEVSTAGFSSGGREVLIVAVRDITQRQRAEQALRRSVSLMRATLESTVDGILAVDINGRTVECNERFAVLWKLPSSLRPATPGIEPAVPTADPAVSPAQTLDSGFAPILGQIKDPDRFLSRLEQIHLNPEGSSIDRLELTDGRTIEWHCRPQRIGDQVVGRVWSFRDITERIAAERAVREFTSQLLRSQDEERQRIAHVLKASITPDLDALTLAIKAATAIHSPDDSPAARYLNNALYLAEQSVGDTRMIADLLYPADLEKAGLLAAARSRTQRFTEIHGVPVTLSVSDWPELPLEYELGFLHVLQLALAMPNPPPLPVDLSVRFLRANDEAILEIRERGRSLAPFASVEFPHRIPHRLGLGPNVARERFSRLSGRLKVQSDSGGTCIAAILPIPSLRFSSPPTARSSGRDKPGPT